MSDKPDGYFAAPPAGHGRPVLVLHAWWGLNETIKTFCDRLAAAGFAAFAPDLYQGEVTDSIAGAEGLAGGLFEQIGRARANVAEAVGFLMDKTDEEAGGLAVVGFSLGAFFALDLSASAPELVSSVVVFYGTRPGDYSSSRAAYLGHFAEADAFEPQAEVDGLAAALKEAGRPVTFHSYPGTGHWFFEPDRADAYDAEAAALAWERTLAFLQGG